MRGPQLMLTRAKFSVPDFMTAARSRRFARFLSRAIIVLIAARIRAVTLVAINAKRRKQVLAEFQRIPVPRPATAGAAQQGGPGDKYGYIAIELAPLARLHIKAPPGLTAKLGPNHPRR